MHLERFDLIDRVVAIETSAGSILCHSQLPQQAELFAGHFPGYPLVPGTLQTEIMAQAFSLLTLGRHGLRRVPFLLGIERARFRRELAPGQALEASATCLYDNGLMTVGRCELRSDNALISTAEIRLSLSEFPTPALRDYVAALAARTGLLVEMAE
jgi:3-hydroxyacyl-[acyl-carrier-protein] dehydratase